MRQENNPPKLDRLFREHSYKDEFFPLMKKTQQNACSTVRTQPILWWGTTSEDLVTLLVAGFEDLQLTYALQVLLGTGISSTSEVYILHVSS